MYVPKGSSTSTLVIRGTGHGSSSGTGGQPPVERGTVPTEGTGTSDMEGAPGDNPHPLGLLEEEVEMMMVMMMIMVMKVMMKMKTQKTFQIVVKMKKGLYPQMMVQVEEEGHYHPHHLVEEQLKVNQEDQGDIEVIEVKEVAEVGQDLKEKEV